MNPQDPLAALQPLREPPPVSWWPPAPGWWFLAALIAVLLLALLVYLWRRHRANAYRRAALAQLEELQRSEQHITNKPEYLARVNALLKSVALIAYPRREVAATTGDQWLTFLNKDLQPGQGFPAELVTSAYRKNAPELDIDRLHSACERWIRHHKVSK